MRARLAALGCAVAAVALWNAASAAETATYEGVGLSSGVAWITQGSPPPVSGAEVRQNGKTFVPNLLVVSVGSSVRFPNDDPFYHSVYSESPSNPFDLGLYDTGPGKDVVFSHPGVVQVHCHVHGSMHATIVVVDGPYALTTANERYRIPGITPGPHVLHVWFGGDTVIDTKISLK